MKEFLFSLLFFVGVCATVTAQWELKSKRDVAFTIDGPLGIDVNGTMQFADWKMEFEPGVNPHIDIAVSLKAESINTSNSKRDKHIKNAPYFETSKYPYLIFRGNTLKAGLKGAYILEGDLTIKGITKKIFIPFAFSYKENDGFISGSVVLNRLDFAVGEKSIGIGNEVRINIELPVKRLIM